jgi:hypothetical protein
MTCRTWAILVVLAAAALPCPARACSLCYNIAQVLTMRQEAEQAKLILYGSIANPRLAAGAGGTSDLQIEVVLKSDPWLAGKKVVEIPRYIPVGDPKVPPRFLVFCDIFGNRLDPYRGVPARNATVAEYLKGALALDKRDTQAALLYFARYLEHADPEIARDAFLEFAKAGDQDVGRIAPRLSPEKVRLWLKEEQTPAERLSLYSFLLGACGGETDAALLRSLLDDANERIAQAYDGVLAGYIHLRPQEGWELAHRLLADAKKPFRQRFAVLRTLRFYHGWKPADSRTQVLKGLAILLPQSDIADLAIEDMRRWEVWDLAPQVLALYGKPGYTAPLMRGNLLRYALSCPRPEARQFIEDLRRREPGPVREAEDALQKERAPAR